MEDVVQHGSGDDGKDQKDEGKGDDGNKESSSNKKSKSNGEGDADMQDAEPEQDEILDEEILSLSTQDLQTRKRLLENDARIMKSEFQRLSHEKATMGEKIKENMEKIANNRFVASNCLLLFPLFLLLLLLADQTILFISQAITLPRWQCC